MTIWITLVDFGFADKYDVCVDPFDNVLQFLEFILNTVYVDMTDQNIVLEIIP